MTGWKERQGLAGARLVEYGQAGTLKSFKKEIESAINDRTCCLSYTVSYNVVPRGTLPFEEIVAVTKASFKVIESIKRGGQQIEI